jgi:hypothetical protein
VQVKAASVTSIIYSASEVEWVLKQDLPVFILTVDIYKGVFCVYTTNPMFETINKTSEGLKVDFSSPTNLNSRLCSSTDERMVFIGPAILIRKLADLHDEVKVNNDFLILRKWIEGESNQVILRKRLKKTSLASWDTNEGPQYNRRLSFGSDVNLQIDMAVVEPYISYLSTHLLFNNNQDPGLKSAFKKIKEWYDNHELNNDIL